MNTQQKRVMKKYQGLSLPSRVSGLPLQVTRYKLHIGSLSVLLLALVFPAVTFAAAPTFKELVGRIITTFNDTIVPVLVGFGVIMIIFGIFRYINAGDDPKKLAEGGKLVLWGVIGVFIMFSIWGLVALILNTVFTSEDRASFKLSGQLWNVPN